MGDFKPVAKLNDVPEGRGITTRADGRALALFNLKGEIFALDGTCPHKGGPLGDGWCENERVYCPLHGWQFDIKTGACVDFPEKPATKYAARVVGDVIEVEL